jgi:hypothetical protein
MNKNQSDDEIIMKEIEKIIGSNKAKASNLRNCVLNLEQNIYTNDIHFKLIQFLGEFEYDLKTLFELFHDFKAKMEINFQNNINSFFEEINSLKIENISLKNEIKRNKKMNKKSEEKSPKYKSNKSSTTLKKNKNMSTTWTGGVKKTNSLNINLKTPSVKKKIKDILQNRNGINLNNNKSNNLTDNQEYILEYMKKNKSQKSQEKNEKINLNPYRPKQHLNSEINFDLDKTNPSNNLNKRRLFFDYDTYLTNLKQNSVYNSQINLIKYDTFLRDNHSNKTDIKEIARGKIFDKNKKKKIISEIFNDEKILNELKKQFGKDIENKLLNENINLQFFKKIEEITKKIKQKIYHTPKIKNTKTFDMKENMSYNFKIPKRFSNKKNDNSLSNLIIAS